MADNKQASPGAGNVEIVLVEQGKESTHVLKPSLEACIHLSRISGGLAAAAERCHRLDFDTVVEVIAAGLGVNPGQKERMVQPAVYETGTIRLSGPCVLFLRVIANGGRLPADDDEEDGDRDPLVNQSQSESSTAD
jgi:hypothetical protein